MENDEKILVLFYDKNLIKPDELQYLADVCKHCSGHKFLFLPKELDGCYMTKEEIIKMIEEW